MPKTIPSTDFKIHVDASCLSSPEDLTMPAERNVSDQTVVRHDSWGEEAVKDAVEEKEDDSKNEPTAEEIALEEDRRVEEEHKKEMEARERQINRIEAQIQAAARAVVASIEQDSYHGEESILSSQTDDSYDHESSELAAAEGIDSIYDGSEHNTEQPDFMEHGNEPQTEYGQGEAAESTSKEPENLYETEKQGDGETHQEDETGDSSSHHDGDIDDVFSGTDGSKRSSLNSVHDLTGPDEFPGKELTSPIVGEEAAQPVSRIPSNASFTPRDRNPTTPSKVMSRPPFRTPSSVRALQMSSPTPSLFSSPRSAKRHMPTVSRIGTPTSMTSFSPSKRTPTRFKAKKEQPLVLLHVTVLPLSWTYSHIISSPDLPPTLQSVRENWRLLQDKLADTVLERGILLPHPQDDYEVLEERLLDALELPVSPRARILNCGHYMGPLTPFSDAETEEREYFEGIRHQWCDICGREVSIDGGVGEEKRFRIKIYASNGLMRAGAWAAAWREMERVDVEIEPYVEGGMVVELEHMAANLAYIQPAEPEKDDYEDEDDGLEHVHDPRTPEQRTGPEEGEATQRRAQEHEQSRKRAIDERMREIYGHSPVTEPPTPSPLSRQQPTRQINEDSLAELLLAAFKVAMKDKKNIAIALLSILVLFLAVRPGTSGSSSAQHVNTAEVEPVAAVSGPRIIHDSVPQLADSPLMTTKEVPYVEVVTNGPSEENLELPTEAVMQSNETPKL